MVHPAADVRHPAGVRGGLADAKVGTQPYLFGLLFDAGRRRELLRSGAADAGTLLAIGIILDVVFQLIIYHAVPHRANSLGDLNSLHVARHSNFLSDG